MSSESTKLDSTGRASVRHAPASHESPAHELAGQPVFEELQRQVQICNACRYCEGFCSVFPAMHRQRTFATSDLIQLANLCHNCRACYHSCQYTEPHEFKINLPNALAEARVDTWSTYIRPRGFAKAFQHHGLAIAGVLVFCITLVFYLIQTLEPTGNPGFYAFLSHAVLVGIFTPAFVVPLAIIGYGLRRYWQAVGGTPMRLAHVRRALANVARLKDLSGGQNQGCNYEKGDRYSNMRRWLHQAAMYGFLLCFASTSSATLLHYLFNSPAPYALLSLPKLLGVPGGILLTWGCAGLAWLKTRTRDSLGATAVWGAEMAFVLLLGATGATGLALYAAMGSTWVPMLLALHLGTVLSLFLLMPFSKMVHGFFRMAALIRDAQL